MNERVAVDLGRRGQEELGPLGPGQAEPVVCPEATDLEDLDRDALEVGRRSRAGEVHHGIDRAGHPEVRAHIVMVEREATLSEQPLDVLRRAGDQVVDGDDLVAPGEQRPAQVRTEEASSSGDDDPRHGRHRTRERRVRLGRSYGRPTPS